MCVRAFSIYLSLSVLSEIFIEILGSNFLIRSRKNIFLFLDVKERKPGENIEEKREEIGRVIMTNKTTEN